MAGIYLHIPFCISKCLYCDFYSVTDAAPTPKFVSDVISELAQRRDYLGDEAVETIYFGGGTPSLLYSEHIHQIISYIEGKFKLSEKAEITLEANPEDLSEDYLRSLSNSRINRLSIGIQSFDDRVLKFLNRRHTAQRALDAVSDVKRFGFENISGDLIYSVPGFGGEEWKKSLQQFFDLDIPHLSAYDLIYEGNTKLFKQLRSGKISAETEEKSEEYFTFLIGETQHYGYKHYELSNFAKPGYESRHNSAYWKAKKYIGVGPAAHSYNGSTRQWNPRDIHLWQQGVRSKNLIAETENLSLKDVYNELIMTGIRTAEGLSLPLLKDKTSERYVEHLIHRVGQEQALKNEGDSVFLEKKYWFVSDSIIAKLFLTNEL